LGDVLNAHSGVYVTLRKDQNIRGYVGHLPGDQPLAKITGQMALQAAIMDKRFAAVKLDELDEIHIEISVLAPYKKVINHKDIMAGRDGVFIKKHGKQALILPNTAVEQGWTRVELLDALCLKAGFPPGSWKTDAKLYTFQAEVFGED
jgi:AmmeMemoRadiSam system protein A